MARLLVNEEKRHLIVYDNPSPMKLLAFVQSSLFKEKSLRLVKRFLESGGCSVNGVVERFASRQLRKGDRLLLRPLHVPSPQERTILFEDRYLQLIDKAAGKTSEELALSHLRMVHRLDRHTSGVLLFAKDIVSQRELERQFATREIHKRYLALVDGKAAENAHLSCRLACKKGNRLQAYATKCGGKSATTDLRRLAYREGVSFVELRPKEGRSHQLRVQLLELNLPILGDYDYSRIFRSPLRPPRPLLHAAEIVFFHPILKQRMTIQAPLPQDFCSYLSLLGIDGSFP